MSKIFSGDREAEMGFWVVFSVVVVVGFVLCCLRFLLLCVKTFWYKMVMCLFAWLCSYLGTPFEHIHRQATKKLSLR